MSPACLHYVHNPIFAKPNGVYTSITPPSLAPFPPPHNEALLEIVISHTRHGMAATHTIIWLWHDHGAILGSSTEAGQYREAEDEGIAILDAILQPAQGMKVSKLEVCPFKFWGWKRLRSLSERHCFMSFLGILRQLQPKKEL